MNDRSQAIGLGQFDPATGQFAAGFGPGGGQVLAAVAASAGRGDRRSRRPGSIGGGRGGGPGGRGAFVLGGRGARGQSPYQGSTTYTFGGSALDSRPISCGPEVPVTQPQFSQNNFGATFGGPVKIPGLYADTNRRTNFQLNYTGNRSEQRVRSVRDRADRRDAERRFFRQRCPACRSQDRPAVSGNQIPASRIDPARTVLLPYIPAPNLPGTQQNYHVSTTAHTSSDSLSLRLTQNCRRRSRQGAVAAVGWRRRRPWRPGGSAVPAVRPWRRRGTNIVLNAQLQYRRNETEALNVFPDLGGHDDQHEHHRADFAQHRRAAGRFRTSR